MDESDMMLSAWLAASSSDVPVSTSWSMLGPLPSAIRVDASSVSEQDPLSLDTILGGVAHDDDVHPHRFTGGNPRANSSLRAASEPVVTGGDVRGIDQPAYPTRARDRNLRSRRIPPPGNPLITIGGSTFQRSEGGASISREILDHPEFRMRRLIESTNRQRVLRSGSSHDSEADSLRNNILQSQTSLEASRKNAAGAGGSRADGSDSQKEEKSDDVSDFECNICFDPAKGPVVTPCGHLFCWQCLYLWLHANSSHSECPVCKGEVLEVNVTPIYGRGGSTMKNKCENGESGIIIPPRPHARRIESTRQQHELVLLQVLEGSVEVGHVNLDEELPNGDRALPRRGAYPRRTSNATQSTTRTRLRDLRSLLHVGSGSNPTTVGMASENIANGEISEHHNNTTLPDNQVVAGGENHDALPPMPTTDLLAQLLHHSRHRTEPSFAADHSSDSSTMAVIHGDRFSHSELQGTSTDASTGPRRRPFITSRRRRRNDIADSVDGDESLNRLRHRRISES